MEEFQMDRDDEVLNCNFRVNEQALAKKRGVLGALEPSGIGVRKF